MSKKVLFKKPRNNRRKAKRRQLGQDSPSQFFRLGNRAIKRGDHLIADLHFLRVGLMEKRKEESEFFPFAKEENIKIEKKLDELNILRESDVWCQSMMEEHQSLLIKHDHIHEESETIKDRIINIDNILFAMRRFLINYSKNTEKVLDKHQYTELILWAHNILGFWDD